MDGSLRSQFSCNASSKSNINYDSPDETDEGQPIFIVSPTPHSWTRIRSRKPQSPQSVVMQLDDFQWLRNTTEINKSPDRERVSPRRSPTFRSPQHTSRIILPKYSPEKQPRTPSKNDVSSLSPGKLSRPPLATNSSSKDRNHRKSRSPVRRLNQDGMISGGALRRSCSRTRRSDSRSKSRARLRSKEKDEQRESTRSCSRSRNKDRHRDRSSSQSRPDPRDRTNESRASSRSRAESGRDKRNSQSRTERSERSSSRRRGTRSNSRPRSQSNSRPRSQFDSRARSRSHNRPRSRSQSRARSRSDSRARRSDDYESRGQHSSGRTHSSSRSAKSPRRSRRGSASSSTISSAAASSSTISSAENKADPGRTSNDNRSCSKFIPLQLDSPEEESNTQEGNDDPPSASKKKEIGASASVQENLKVSAVIRLQTVFRAHFARSRYKKTVFIPLQLDSPAEESNTQEGNDDQPSASSKKEIGALAGIQENLKVSAVIRLQTVFRTHLARTRYKKAVLKRDEQALEASRLEKRRAQEEQLKLMEEQLRAIEQQSKADRRKLKTAFRAEKRAAKERVRTKLKRLVKKLAKDKLAEQKAVDSLGRLELSELANESKRLKEDLKDMENKILNEKNRKVSLLQAHNDISKVFDSLNEFCRKQTEGRKKLVTASEKLSRLFKPKIKAALREGVLACSIETKLKELHRGYMYKLAQGVHGSDLYDQLLHEEVMELITECEGSLGNDAWNLHQSIDYLDFGSSENAEVLCQNLDESRDLSNSNASLNLSFTLDAARSASSSWQESGEVDLNVNWNASQFHDSGSQELAGGSWGANEVSWSSGKLGELLDEKLQLIDIDCQSHNSWQTEHGSLITWIE
jgi:hypothetical protein